MLYYVFSLLHVRVNAFNVFRYITFRTVLAILSALIISFYLTPRAIRTFQAWKIRNGKREDVPERHETKKQTPTMGGSVILLATIIPTLLWADLRNQYVWLVTGVFVAFGLIGYLDDIRKLKGLNGKGMPGRTKLLLEIACALAVSVLIYGKGTFATQLSIPFFKNATPDLGFFYIALCVLIIVGSSNGVNLTDGLDGLAIGPVITVCATFLLFAYLVGNVKFAQYLQIFYVKGAGELTVLCGAMLGCGHWLSVVQRVPGRALHGRHRVPFSGRRPRYHRRDDQAGIPPRHRGGHLRHGDPVRHHPGPLLQVAREKGIQDGSHTSSFRAEGLE